MFDENETLPLSTKFNETTTLQLMFKIIIIEKYQRFQAGKKKTCYKRDQMAFFLLQIMTNLNFIPLSSPSRRSNERWLFVRQNIKHLCYHAPFTSLCYITRTAAIVTKQMPVKIAGTSTFKVQKVKCLADIVRRCLVLGGTLRSIPLITVWVHLTVLYLHLLQRGL